MSLGFLREIMTDQIPDDIFALYSRFDLDENNYHVFSRPDPNQKRSPSVRSEDPCSASAAASEIAPEAQSAERKLRLSPAPLFVPTPSTGLAPSEFLDRESGPTEIPTGSSSRMALQQLWRRLAVSRENHSSDAVQLASSSISIYGAAGGVGSTTIAATLARLLARSGRRCAIFDDVDDPSLPIFFGSQRLTSNERRFAGLYSIFEPGVRILTRDMFPGDQLNAPVDLKFIERNLSHCASEFDHLIFDHPARSAECVGAGVKIYVAVPDVGSLAGMQKLKRRLEPPEAESKALCVLNRFDPTSALHREVRGWYQENFPQVLTIHYSTLIPEALAEGTTVVDWTPQAGVTTDLLNVFRAVNRQLAIDVRPESLHSGSERLPLCS